MIFLHIDMVWGFSIFIVCAFNVASTLEMKNTNLEDGEQMVFEIELCNGRSKNRKRIAEEIVFLYSYTVFIAR